jgi:Enolase C-terminal domain-like
MVFPPIVGGAVRSNKSVAHSATSCFREVLEKKAATILQPDLCHAGGITEVRLIAGMAEAYYATIAPHNPLGPISLAAGIQLAASIPNFLCQEQVSLGEGYLKRPFVVRNGYIDVPAGPGLGIELDDTAVARQVGHDWRNRDAFDEDDGSVMDCGSHVLAGWRSAQPVGLLGMVAINARRTALTDSRVVNTSATSGSRTTSRPEVRHCAAKRFGRALR